MSDSIFYDVQQQLGPPSQTAAPVESLFYDTENDLGPLPTGWWMDIDENPLTPPDGYATITYDHPPMMPWYLTVRALWAYGLAVVILVAVLWLLLL